MNSKITSLFLSVAILFPRLSPLLAAERADVSLSPLPPPAKKFEDLKLKHDSFTFVRIKYSGPKRVGGSSASSWSTDYPDADLNFSFRFNQVTGLKTDLQGKTLELTDAALTNYPFIYIAEAGYAHFSDHETAALRNYLLGGGFLMVDDFWGEAEWQALHAQIKGLFPDLEPIDLSIDHPIFHIFYDLKEKPQVPSIHVALHNKTSGITWERQDAKEPHYRALLDKNGRIIALFCHNTDLADGWEREAEDKWYFTEFSSKRAYPMGVNIVLYALSH